MQKATQTKTNKQATEQKVVRLEDKVLDALQKAQAKDNNIRIQKVTGYTSIKYGNKVLFELHLKTKSITHLTFSDKQKVYEYLKTNKLITRKVPTSFGWKYNTECLLTADFEKHINAVIKAVIDEAVEQRNLKNKQANKKVANK